MHFLESYKHHIACDVRLYAFGLQYSECINIYPSVFTGRSTLLYNRASSDWIMAFRRYTSVSVLEMMHLLPL